MSFIPINLVVARLEAPANDCASELNVDENTHLATAGSKAGTVETAEYVHCRKLDLEIVGP
jgi:hypothetical protein